MKCVGTDNRPQCGNRALSGSTVCRRCAHESQRATAYKINDPKLKEAVGRHAQSSLLDISNEIVLAESIVERRINMAGTSTVEQINAHNFVASQLSSNAKMKETLVKLGKESGNLMSKSEVDAHVDQVTDILIEELKTMPGFESVIDKIVSRINAIGESNE